MLPLEFADGGDWDRIGTGDELRLDGLHDALGDGDGDGTGTADGARATLRLRNLTRDEEYTVRHRLSARQREVVRAGGVIPALTAGHMTR